MKGIANRQKMRVKARVERVNVGWKGKKAAYSRHKTSPPPKKPGS